MPNIATWVLAALAAFQVAHAAPQGNGYTASAPAKISKDGSCGPNGGSTCLGSSFGDCCSQYGYCGSSSTCCGKGCNPLFGKCAVTPSISRQASIPVQSSSIVQYPSIAQYSSIVQYSSTVPSSSVVQPSSIVQSSSTPVESSSTPTPSAASSSVVSSSIVVPSSTAVSSDASSSIAQSSVVSISATSSLFSSSTPSPASSSDVSSSIVVSSSAAVSSDISSSVAQSSSVDVSSTAVISSSASPVVSSAPVVSPSCTPAPTFEPTGTCNLQGFPRVANAGAAYQVITGTNVDNCKQTCFSSAPCQYFIVQFGVNCYLYDKPLSEQGEIQADPSLGLYERTCFPPPGACFGEGAASASPVPAVASSSAVSSSSDAISSTPIPTPEAASSTPVPSPSPTPVVVPSSTPEAVSSTPAAVSSSMASATPSSAPLPPACGIAAYVRGDQSNYYTFVPGTNAVACGQRCLADAQCQFVIVSGGVTCFLYNYPFNREAQRIPLSYILLSERSCFAPAASSSAPVVAPAPTVT